MNTKLRMSTAITAALLALVVGTSASASLAPQPNLSPNHRWVLDHPDIHNIFWDSDWSKHNPWSRHAINEATLQLIDDGYFSPLAQYGVDAPTLGGSHDSAAAPECDVFGGATAPHQLTSLRLFEWITCVASHLHTQSREPASNDLYVVFLPQHTTLVDGPTIGSITVAGVTLPGITIPLSQSCKAYTGYHFFGLSARGPFAYVVIPSACALSPAYQQTSYEALTETMSHEMVEAMTDPIITQGWIDDAFTGVNLFLKAEAADLCLSSPGNLIQSNAITGDHVDESYYWSNSAKGCVA